MKAKQILLEFKCNLKIKRLSERTIKSYYNNNNNFLTFIESEFDVDQIEDITSGMFKQFMSYLVKKDLKPSYCNNIYKCVRQFMRYCCEENYIPSDITAKTPFQKVGRTVIKTFTDDEVISLLNAFNGKSYLQVRNKLIIAIAIDTGIRNTEICTLMTADIEDSKILIHGKGNKERYVPISPYLKKWMLKYDRTKEGYFKDKILKYDNYFLSRTGKPLTKEALEYVFVLAKQNATIRDNIRCSPHTARHYFAQTSIKNGCDVYTLSRLLGHTKIDITKVYLQSMEDESIVEMATKTSPLSFLKM